MKLRIFWKGLRIGLPYNEYLVKSFSFDGKWLRWEYLDQSEYESGETKLEFVYKFEVVK